MDKKTTRLQFKDDDLSSPAVEKAAGKAARAADKADRVKAKLPSDKQPSGSKKLKLDEDKSAERQAQLRFGKKDNTEKELSGSKRLKGKSESKLKHSSTASEKAFIHEDSGVASDYRNNTADSATDMPADSAKKSSHSVATSTDDFVDEVDVSEDSVKEKARETSRKNEKKSSLKRTDRAKNSSRKGKLPDGKTTQGKASAGKKLKDSADIPSKISSRLRFEDEGVILDPRNAKGRTAVLSGTAMVSGGVHKKISENNQDENAGTNAMQMGTEAAEAGARAVDHVGYSRKLKQYDKALKLDKKADKANVNALFEADKAENPEKYSNPFSRWMQKQKIKKEYAAAQAAARAEAARSGGAGATAEAAKKGGDLIEKLRFFVVDHSGPIKMILLILILLALILTQLQSCSTMITGALTTVTATSWPADDKEISKAEAYYVKLECELQKKLNNIESSYPGSAEYNVNQDEIKHDPSVLISYLCAKYGDFKLADVKDEIETLFNLQYQLRAETRTENKTATVKVRRGESLGNVVTSGYCNCSICCGRWAGGATASGVMPRANHTIAVDASTPTVPMGTEIIMNGVLYKVEDTGNFTRYGVDFDVYYDSHSAASAHGHKNWEAFYAGGSGPEVEVTTTSNVRVTYVTLTSKDLETICNRRMNEEEKNMYDVYQMTHGNRMFFGTPVEYNWHENILGQYGYRYDYTRNRVVTADDMLLSFPEGIKVISVMDGTVKSVSGSKVVLQDEHNYEVAISGLSGITVSAGQTVEMGQKIGKVSSSQQLIISFKYRGVDFNPYFYMDTGTAVIAAPGIASEKAARLITEAKKYLGTPYVWGGYSPSGFDCSGYVSYCLTHSGVKNTGHLTANGLLGQSRRIAKSQLQPGDLVFFQGTYDTSGASHVGIFIGSGQYGSATFIHCGDPCQYGNLNSSYWIDHWLTGGRILD